MGIIDAEGKRYFSVNSYFADMFNYLLYDGRKMIQPDKLKELDTTEIAIPYGNGARVPVQKYRDILKLWSAMMDDTAVYVMLGAELQDKTHYAMPVKDALYDMLGYTKQIAEIKKSYSKRENNSEGELVITNGVLKIKLTGEEFLSGLRKGDKLIPIITAVVYLGDKPWDGPKSLYDMLDIRNDVLKKFIPNYWINLISPLDMGEDEFDKFHTDLGFAMKVLKHQSYDADKIIMTEGHRRIDTETAVFLNNVANLKLEYEEENEIDMCKAMENKEKKDRITGAIQGMRIVGVSDEEILTKVAEAFHVTREYVLEILTPQQV